MAEQIRIIELTPGEGLLLTVGGEKVFVKAVAQKAAGAGTTTVVIDVPTEDLPHPREPEIWQPGPGDHILAVRPVDLSGAGEAGTVRAGRLPGVAGYALADATRTKGMPLGEDVDLLQVAWEDQAWPEAT